MSAVARLFGGPSRYRLVEYWMADEHDVMEVGTRAAVHLVAADREGRSGHALASMAADIENAVGWTESYRPAPPNGAPG